jgi:sporulation protein YlmC with PRC-barrel domain
MKTPLIIGAAVAILGVAAAPIFAQTQTTATNTAGGTTYVQTSKVVGTKVKTAQGEEVGVIKDVVLDRNTGCMAYTVLSAGGGGTRVSHTKMVAVPWTVYSTTSDPSVLTVQVDRERIYNAPAFDYARITEYSNPTWINSVYSYYGVSGQVGVSGERQFGAESRTNAQVGAGATNVNPNAPAAASPAATAGAGYGAAPTAAASPQQVAASPAATASAAPSATASRKSTRGESTEESPTKGKTRTGEKTSTSRHHAEPAGTEEGTQTGTETKSTRGKTREEGAEPTTSPSRDREPSRRHTNAEEETTTGAQAQPTPQE